MREVILDTREKDKAFVAFMTHFAEVYESKIIRKALPFGDIACGNMIIERKEINDFASSLTSPRLWEQVQKMLENKDYISTIIISGTEDNLAQRNLKTIPALRGSIAKIIKLRIPVLTVKDDRALSAMSFAIFEQSDDIDIPIKHVKKNDSMSIFRSLPGIGRKNGEILENEYRNICGLVQATEEELQEKIGEKKGTKVYKALRGIK